jgi:hypothetical protein
MIPHIIKIESNLKKISSYLLDISIHSEIANIIEYNNSIRIRIAQLSRAQKLVILFSKMSAVMLLVVAQYFNH